MVYFWWQPATSLQNFIYLCQSATEILLFVQKSKMAAAAILDLIFVSFVYFAISACKTSIVVPGGTVKGHSGAANVGPKGSWKLSCFP